MNNLFILFYSPKPRSHVRILIFWKLPVDREEGMNKIFKSYSPLVVKQNKIPGLKTMIKEKHQVEETLENPPNGWQPERQ